MKKITIGSISLMLLFSIFLAPSCNKPTDSTNRIEQTLETKSSSRIYYDGKYTGVLPYHGEKITSTSIVKNGKLVSRTYTKESGEPIYPEDITPVHSSFNKEAAYESFIENFDKYPCLYFYIEEKPAFISGESDYMYTVLGGPSDEDGGCWYDEF